MRTPARNPHPEVPAHEHRRAHLPHHPAGGRRGSQPGPAGGLSALRGLPDARPHHRLAEGAGADGRAPPGPGAAGPAHALQGRLHRPARAAGARARRTTTCRCWCSPPTSPARRASGRSPAARATSSPSRSTWSRCCCACATCWRPASCTCASARPARRRSGRSAAPRSWPRPAACSPPRSTPAPRWRSWRGWRCPSWRTCAWWTCWRRTTATARWAPRTWTRRRRG